MATKINKTFTGTNNYPSRPGRFRDIKSNPSSKILRFDRSDNISETPGSAPVIISGSRNINRYFRTNASGSSLTMPSPRRTSLPHNHQQKKERNSRNSSVNSSSNSNTSLPGQLTPGNILAQDLRSSKTSKGSQQTSSKSKPQHQEVATQGGQPVALRKPTVRGFNVKKALLEDPRTFHTAHNRSYNNADTTTTATTTTHHQTTSRNHNNNKQLKDAHNRKVHIHFARTHHSR